MAGNVPRQAVVTDRLAGFRSGQTVNPQQKQNTVAHHSEAGGDALNAGRSNISGAHEVHYSGDKGDVGTTAIANNPGGFSGRDNAPR